MNDIYEHKAKKYKYKYKKLKQYISEGGANNYCKLNKNLTGKDFKKLKIKQVYIDPDPKYKLFFDPKNKSFFDPNIIDKYDERILSNEEYEKENNNYIIISKYINEKEFIKIKSKQIFVGEIKKKINISNSILKTLKTFKYNYETIDESIFKNYDCNISNDKYIYIINSKFPDTKLFTEIIKDKTYNINNILTSIQKFIDNILIPLYDKGYVFGNIKKENMTLDNDNNIYFIEKTKIHEYDEAYEIREFANEDNYPSILRYFTQIKIANYLDSSENIFKKDFRYFLENIQKNDITNIFEKSITDLNKCIELNNKQDKSINIHYGTFYGNKITELKKENDVFKNTISYEIYRTHKESLDLLKIKDIFNNFIEKTKIRYDDFTIDSTQQTNEIINEIKSNNNELIQKIILIKQELIEIFKDKKIFINIYKELQEIYNDKYHYAQIKDIFKILKPISENTDIYAISKLIHDIDNTNTKIIKLYEDAKYNKIENPIALKKRLEAIIN